MLIRTKQFLERFRFNLWIMLILTSFTSFSTFAQSEKINGIIFDKTTQIGLEGTIIKNITKNKYTTSKADGSFSITGNIGDLIEFKHIGYLTIQAKAESNQAKYYLESTSEQLAEHITLGTRSVKRVTTSTSVPVDVIKYSQIAFTSARTDIVTNLNYSVPSFNYNKQTGSDGADHMEVGTLRGLGPDQTLVLLNGKRQHPTAFVALFGTRGRANSGVDLSLIPSSMVETIEVLRDGASAQYGSDAIAGVINIILKKNSNWNVVVGSSAYYDNKFNSNLNNDNNQYLQTKSPLDGLNVNLSVNNGWDLGKRGGFINVDFEYVNQDKTFRQAGANDLPENPYRRGFGDASASSQSLFYNLELPASKVHETLKFYSFGGGTTKTSDAYAYSRNWYPYDIEGGATGRFPRTLSGDLFFDPSIMRSTKDGETIYFNPHIKTVVTDLSEVVGFKGETKSNWAWDLSSTLGYNDFHFFTEKSYNASNVGSITPNNFDAGGFNFTQFTNNFDISKSFGKEDQAGNFNLAFGAEARFEQYQLYNGEPLSYSRIPNDFGLAGGSQGFPGFLLKDNLTATRNNLAVYADIEWNPFKKWQLDFAMRGENYSDFGPVSTFKIASLLELSKIVNLRGSASTGFRAPSLQQINFQNTITSFAGGMLTEARIANNNDPLARLAGIPKLKQETSINFSFGVALKPIKNLTITVDFYQIILKDRIVLSGLYSASSEGLPPALIEGIQNANASTVQFFTNAINTTSRGVDIVADYFVSFGKNNNLKILLAGNIQNLTIDKINVPANLSGNQSLVNTFFTTREQAFLKASAPNSKFNLNVDYNIRKVGFGIKLTQFGEVVTQGYGSDANNYDGNNPVVPSDADENVLVPDQYVYSPKVVLDFYFKWKISNVVSFFTGVDNVLNAHPDFTVNPLAKGWAYNGESGGAWESVQMGYNGRRIFSKLILTF